MKLGQHGRILWQGKANECRCRLWLDGPYVRVQWLRPDGRPGLYPQKPDGSSVAHWQYHEYVALKTAVCELADELEDLRVALIDIDVG